jgi:predicted TIM-barrel fold metal-dependent hydrolase
MEYEVISADSHVIEPHDLWQQRVDAEFRDRVPRLVHDEDTDRLVCDQADLPPVGLLAGCARGDDEVRRWDEDVFVGGYDPDVRLGDLERDGVDAEVLFPTIAMQFYPIQDITFQWQLFRAYNTWLAEDFCASHPERYKGIAMLNHEDTDVAVAELKRSRDIGLSGVMVPLYAGEENPYYDPRFDDLWEASVEYGMPINLHAATTRDKSKSWDKGTPVDGILSTYQVQHVLMDMILYGLFDRFPDLTVVSAESDVGWAGNLLERADYWWQRFRKLASRKYAICDRPPSGYWHANVRVTFMRDRTGVLAREVIGTEVMMWGNDFPHHVSTWPNSQAVLGEHFDDQPDEVRQAIVRDNVRALYDF